MDERRITILECIDLIRNTNINAASYTTWDMGIAEHVRRIIIETIEEEYDIPHERNE
jgi:hypothetical protein